MVLQSKLSNGVTVQSEYAGNLPRIEAYGSELNQVWTNLIDNAHRRLRMGTGKFF